MDMIPVESSNIQKVGYDSGERKLRIEFVKGAKYEYSEVPESTVKDLLSADSIGSFFHRHIRGLYHTERISA